MARRLQRWCALDLGAEPGELKRITSVGQPRDLTRSATRSTSSGTTRRSSRRSSPARLPRYDAVTGGVERELDLYSCTVAGGEGVLWSMGLFGDKRLSTDPGELRILRNVTLPYRQPTSVETTRMNQRDLAVGYGRCGAGRRDRPADVAARSHSGRILATIKLPFIPRTVAAGEEASGSPRHSTTACCRSIQRPTPSGRRFQQAADERHRHGSRLGLGNEHDRPHRLAHRPVQRPGRRPDRRRRAATRDRGWGGRCG